jgi:antitoxin (DNA-binding transcriptional repressor) of toxin-antitoxin stability system
MAVVHMSEAEVVKDIAAVLAKVRQGVEVVVEQDHRPVAVIRPSQRSGRPISEIVRQAKERNSSVTLDADFGTDLQDIIASHENAWNPPYWE